MLKVSETKYGVPVSVKVIFTDLLPLVTFAGSVSLTMVRGTHPAGESSFQLATNSVITGQSSKLKLGTRLGVIPSEYTQLSSQKVEEPVQLAATSSALTATTTFAEPSGAVPESEIV